MKYEDVSWHSGAENFPKELPAQAGGTHTGMFVAWALLGGLGNPEFFEDLAPLKTRSTTPGRFFYDQCDGKFVDDELNDEGNAFTAQYFDAENGRYLHDYAEVLSQELETAYHVADTWANFERLKPLLDRRLAEWRSGALPGKKPWWKFWGD